MTSAITVSAENSSGSSPRAPRATLCGSVLFLGSCQWQAGHDIGTLRDLCSAETTAFAFTRSTDGSLRRLRGTRSSDGSGMPNLVLGSKPLFCRASRECAYEGLRRWFNGSLASSGMKDAQWNWGESESHWVFFDIGPAAEDQRACVQQEVEPSGVQELQCDACLDTLCVPSAVYPPPTQMYTQSKRKQGALNVFREHP
ncbi:hypothetical protein DFP72DRAFT_616646 [Ephemerocybe angulata]|uniref:Uncharacterized protein n=1 Tax=Ephemerocybe angulata TaxID=980116 RepID=A0A8H6HJF5_9AGAR|nr:hypothetical protein DFP72DRAFT_616646 [Tulosesus angulatus]